MMMMMMMKVNVSGVICLMGEGQMHIMKHELDVYHHQRSERHG
jgi:hypothetical protein